MLAMQTLAAVSVAAPGNARELLEHRGFELVVSALRASSMEVAEAEEQATTVNDAAKDAAKDGTTNGLHHNGLHHNGLHHNALSIRVSSLMATSALLSVPEGRRKLPPCLTMKTTLYDILISSFTSTSSTSSTTALLWSALASLYHVAMSDDLPARSSLIERGCLYPLLRLALSSSSSSSSSSHGHDHHDHHGHNQGHSTRTASCPWFTPSSSGLLRPSDVAVRVLLIFAGFRQSGHAVTNDDEHDYVRQGLNKILSEPMVRLLARSFANLPTTSNSSNRSNSSNSSSSRWCDLLLKETVSPLLIWDDQMRQSVVRFVDTQTFDTVDEGIFLVVVVVVGGGGGGSCACSA